MTKTPRVWLASKGTEKALRLSESDGWEVHEVAKAPASNSPEDIRQSMELLQQIHRDSLFSNQKSFRQRLLDEYWSGSSAETFERWLISEIERLPIRDRVSSGRTLYVVTKAR